MKINDYFEICVLTFNRLEFVMACLSSIINFTKVPYKLIVIDNGSTDGTKEFLQVLKDKNHIHTLVFNKENKGIAESKNQFLDLVEWKSDFIVMTDSDIVFPYTSPCWITQMLDIMTGAPEIGVLGLNFNDVNVAEDTKWWFSKQHEKHRMKNGYIELVSGFWGTLIPKATIDSVRKYNQSVYKDDKVFRCRSLYGETDEMFRQAIGKRGQACAIAPNLVGYNLGWDDKAKFVNYHIFKKIERSKAEAARKQGK